MKKIALDILLVEKGFAKNRDQAQILIMAGQVLVNGQVAFVGSEKIYPNAQLELKAGARYVSRGGEKLASAIEVFHTSPKGLICVDVGASTGGFTDCLLQNGAVKVYAIDVGKGILHWKLRNESRVVVMENTNARNVESFPDPVQFIVCDASFISLKILLPVIKKWLLLSNSSTKPFNNIDGDLIVLIKPQFEAKRKDAAKGKGVISDPSLHKQILFEILQFAVDTGFGLRGLIKSPLIGPKGNVEFLLWLDLKQNNSEISVLVDNALDIALDEKSKCMATK